MSESDYDEAFAKCFDGRVFARIKNASKRSISFDEERDMVLERGHPFMSGQTFREWCDRIIKEGKFRA